MKSCDEMAKDVFRRIEEHNENRKKKVKKAVSVMIPAVSFCVAIAVGAGVWMLKGNTPGVEIKDPPDSAGAYSEIMEENTSSQVKEYISFEAEAYYETMLEEGEQELKGTAYHNPKLTRKLLKEIPEDLAKTVTRKVFGVEREYILRQVYENENLNLKIGSYTSQHGQSIEIHPVTENMLRYYDAKDTVGKPGKQRVSDEELIEKATEYLAEFTDENIAQYSIELSRDTDYSQSVSFAVKKKGERVYIAHSVFMDYSGEFWYYVASDYNSYQEIREFSEDAFKQVEAVALEKINYICQENAIDLKKVKTKGVSLYYSKEDGCPVVIFAYALPIETDNKINERIISIYVKAK